MWLVAVDIWLALIRATIEFLNLVFATCVLSVLVVIVVLMVVLSLTSEILRLLCRE